MFTRNANLKAALARKSMLLLGPRMTGKSTLLRQALPDAVTIDLLQPAMHRDLAARPERLADLARSCRPDSEGQRVVVVDEVQKVPELLDEAHRLIEADPSLRVVLTGSSARKLRRTGVNLLAGRATPVQLFPLCQPERASHPVVQVPLDRALQHGSLPFVLLDPEPARALHEYVSTYVEQEVLAEGLARNYGAFARFLEVAAATNGEQVVFANIARDAEVPARTVADYYQLLDDTLLGTTLPPFTASVARKAVTTAKFYFFDVGVAHALQRRTSIAPASAEWGKALEHLVYCELRAAIGYQGLFDLRLGFWRSQTQHEVDFVVSAGREPLLGIEVKAARHIERRDLRGLRALGEEFAGMRRLVVCQAAAEATLDDGTQVGPVEAFLRRLWSPTGLRGLVGR